MAEPIHCSDMAPLDGILARYPRVEASLIQVLQDVQRAYNHIPCDVLTRVSESLGVPLARVFSVATFYKAFSVAPQGRVMVKVCMGTACHIRGAPHLVEELGRKLEIEAGETTPDLEFTLKTVNCVGACAMAPVMIVNDTYHGNAMPAKVSSYLGKEGAQHAN